MLSYSYSIQLRANGIKEPLFPDAWSLGPAGIPGLQNMAGLHTICPRPSKAIIKLESSTGLGAPLLFFQDDGAVTNPIEFVPGDAFSNWLSYQWLATVQPYCISTKTPTIGGTNAGVVTAAEGAPTLLTTGIDTSSEKDISFTVGAALTNVVAYSYRIWGLTTATLDAAGTPIGWVPLFQSTASGPAGGTVNLGLLYSRVFIEISSITPVAAGAVSVSRTFSTDGNATAAPTVIATAWWEII